MEQTFNFNIPISKVDEEQRIVYGIATTEDIDVQGDIVDFEASKRAFPAWVGNIREMHGPVAIGKAIDIQFDEDKKQVMIGAKISESADGQNAWIKVKEGVLAGFSIGGKVKSIKTEKAGDEQVNRITDYSLAEVSLVDNPANPMARLVMVKSYDGELRRVEVPERITNPYPELWWHKYFMAQPLPMASDESGYDKGMTKKDNSQVEKSVYGADFLVDLACQLAGWIAGEQANGEDVSDLAAALATIKQAAIGELSESETAEDEMQDMLSSAVELAQKSLSLKKENDMTNITKAGAFVEGEDPRDEKAQVVTKVTASPNAKKAGIQAPAPIKKSTAVVAGEERDADAETVTTAEENGRPVNDTQERADEAGVPVAGAVVAETESEDGEVQVEVQPPVYADGAAEKPEDTTPESVTQEAEAEEEQASDGAEEQSEGKSSDESESVEEKSSEVQDLIKSVNGLIAAQTKESNDDLAKSIAKAVEDKVAAAVKPLEDRIASLEGQPGETKVKASYIEVAKGGTDEAEADEVQELIKRAEFLAAHPHQAKPGEAMDIAVALRKAQASK